MLTIDAPSWSGISGASVRMPSMVPVRLIPMTRFQFVQVHVEQPRPVRARPRC